MIPKKMEENNGNTLTSIHVLYTLDATHEEGEDEVDEITNNSSRDAPGVNVLTSTIQSEDYFLLSTITGITGIRGIFNFSQIQTDNTGG